MGCCGSAYAGVDLADIGSPSKLQVFGARQAREGGAALLRFSPATLVENAAGKRTEVVDLGHGGRVAYWTRGSIKSPEQQQVDVFNADGNLAFMCTTRGVFRSAEATEGLHAAEKVFSLSWNYQMSKFSTEGLQSRGGHAVTLSSAWKSLQAMTGHVVLGNLRGGLPIARLHAPTQGSEPEGTIVMEVAKGVDVTLVLAVVVACKVHSAIQAETLAATAFA